ncbi:toprim domain-containing protein [Phenylobacterium sp. 58.2.17]|uniref:DUF7146 domain-containing protein n=1 Tax=Phenylobacterium sp. 58.2.17 TaxID=2969306 RepID=UPI0022641F42|nr:toprim domain-containing protein [Phenylobacterium sp. 58.2.17]MCX7587304.1 toprim domain-containing protein [Phenylobacterium sp. 58.2.17]
MRTTASDLAQRLAVQAEAVCRHYLSKGRREGRYWLAGDVRNTPGRSLYVRLADAGAGRGAVGKWTDAATGDHGDLLDLIAQNRGFHRLSDTLDEARRFLALPPSISTTEPARCRSPGWSTRSSLAAERLFAISTPIRGTLAETYLRKRGIDALTACEALRFHPRCFYRPSHDDAAGVRGAWPAMIAAVTDLTGRQVGAHRTWLDPATADKAPVASPRRAMGRLLGHGVRLGRVQAVMAAGEGLETMLSLRCALPALPAVAALSSAHLAALHLPETLRRLYIARDDDRAGHTAAATLADRAARAGIETAILSPRQADFNDDLRHLGPNLLAAVLRVQLVREDIGRLWSQSQ